MTVLELIKVLKKYDCNMQVILSESKSDNNDYKFININDIVVKNLYPDLSTNDNSTNSKGEKENYIILNNNIIK